ncbi:MAG: glutaredoxin domain-containing protein [Candidatus Paceibacterota bacterium]|jgi:glutaredoxin-like YruB-family protein
MENKKVIIYSTTTCPYCVMAKDYFKKKGVAYEDKNVGVDRAAGQEMVTKSGQMGVPVIDINGEIIVGFQPEVFEELLNK